MESKDIDDQMDYIKKSLTQQCKINEEREVMISQNLSNFENIIQNSLIAENIVKHLNIGALKNCRLISKSLKNAISESHGFLSRVLLRIHGFALTKEVSEKGLSFIDNLNETNWANIGISLFDDFEIDLKFPNFPGLQHRFERCSFLKIYDSYTSLQCGPYDGNMLKISQLLCHFISLSHLEMEEGIFESFCKGEINDNSTEKLEKIFSQLREFKIIEGLRSSEFYLEEGAPNPSILVLLSTIKNLASFEFSSRLSRFFDQNGVNHVFQIAQKSSSTIVKLNLNFEGFDQRMNFPAFSSLKNLTIRDKSVQGSVAHNFLQCQPMENLKFLSLTILNVLSESTLNMMRQRCGNLEELHIKTCKIKELGQFEFISSFPLLKNFEIFVPRIIGQFEEIQNNPGNEFILSSFRTENLKELVLRGLNLHGFSSFIDHSNKLMNLTNLSILQCSSFFDNDKIKFICQNFTKLQRLEFSNCPLVTDYGITGMYEEEGSNENVEFSLKNLKGLKALRMINCVNITDFSCRFGIKFLDLELLDLSLSEDHSFFNVTEIGVKSLIENNPSLKTLILCSEIEIEFSRDFLEKLSTKQNLNLSFPKFKLVPTDSDDEFPEPVLYDYESDDGRSDSDYDDYDRGHQYGGYDFGCYGRDGYNQYGRYNFSDDEEAMEDMYRRQDD